MIVEDSLITVIHLEKLVTNAGHHVLNKTDYAEKVAPLCKEQLPDLILMDIMLNGDMTGLDAAEQLRSSHLDVPIIFISALSDTKTQKRINAVTNSALVGKPFDHHELVSKINTLLT